MNVRTMDNRAMRAGRLLSMLLILQREGRVTAARLAEQLEVSERTVLRDIDELSAAGVPVYATRGPGGGFALLEGYRSDLQGPEGWQTSDRRPGPRPRGVIRISPEGRRLAAVLRFLQPLRVSRAVGPDADGWNQASFPIYSMDSAVIELLALSPHAEALSPPRLREQVKSRLGHAAKLYGSTSP
jgi:predicted DNA-binding transcriptional regulator YafY